MFRATVTRRWQKTAKSAVQNSSDSTRSKDTDSKGQKHPSSVQWAIDLHKATQRKHYSESQLQFDKALKKLAEVSTMLERSAMLERGFEKDLRTIQDKLQIGYLHNDAGKKQTKQHWLQETDWRHSKRVLIWVISSVSWRCLNDNFYIINQQWVRHECYIYIEVLTSFESPQFHNRVRT